MFDYDEIGDVVYAVLFGQNDANNRTCTDIKCEKFVRQNNTPLFRQILTKLNNL